MTNESKIDLLISKSKVYKYNFLKSNEKGDTEAADKWKNGYNSIREKISELKEN